MTKFNPDEIGFTMPSTKVTMVSDLVYIVVSGETAFPRASWRVGVEDFSA